MVDFPAMFDDQSVANRRSFSQWLVQPGRWQSRSLTFKIQNSKILPSNGLNMVVNCSIFLVVIELEEDKTAIFLAINLAIIFQYSIR